MVFRNNNRGKARCSLPSYLDRDRDRGLNLMKHNPHNLNGLGTKATAKRGTRLVDRSETRKHEITLPLPPIKCSPNGRGKHWGAKARAVKSYREACGLIVKHFWKQRDVIKGMVTIDLDFYLCKGWHADGLYFPRDPDNAVAATKAAIDSLKDAGVIEGDTKKYVTIGAVRLHTKKPEHQNRTELVITLNSV